MRNQLIPIPRDPIMQPARNPPPSQHLGRRQTLRKTNKAPRRIPRHHQHSMPHIPQTLGIRNRFPSKPPPLPADHLCHGNPCQRSLRRHEPTQRLHQPRDPARPNLTHPPQQAPHPLRATHGQLQLPHPRAHTTAPLRRPFASMHILVIPWELPVCSNRCSDSIVLL